MSLFLDDVDVRLYQGDVRETLAQLEAESVHCVVTSPPYWGLRDYGTGQWEGGNPDCDHVTAPGAATGNKGAVTTVPFKDVCRKCGASRVDNQLGLEPTPDLYLENMVDVFREVRRVLRSDGTLWLNMGDSYASSPKGNPEALSDGLTNQGRNAQRANAHRTRSTVVGGMKPKDLCMIPARLALALQADGWWVRSQIVWSKPNPMPESVTDRPTTSHEFVYLLAKSPRYYFDAEAVREPHTPATLLRDKTPRGRSQNGGGSAESMAGYDYSREGLGNMESHPAGRNIRSVWEIPTQAYPEAHFATYPEELVRRCILAGTSERGCCPECGAPWVREVEARSLNRNELPKDHPEWRPSRYDNGKAGDPQSPGPGQRFHEAVTTGWRPSCKHTYPGPGSNPIPCTVLDPFLGSGTTAHVARKHGRNCVGIELNPSYCELAAKRLSQLSLLAVQP